MNHALALVACSLFAGGIFTSNAQDKPSAEQTGAIHGRITISAERLRADARMTGSPGNRYGTHGSRGGMDPGMKMASPDTVAPRLSERAVVYLEGGSLAQAKYPLPAVHPRLDQRGIQFHPQLLPVLVGTTVDFPNRDNLFHNVFSYSSPKEFDLGRYPINDSRSVTFDRAGVVRVYCDIHANMNATIIVLPHKYFAAPDDQGNYELSGVPEGKYTLVIWYDREEADRVRVNVTAGERLEINITL